MDDTARLILFTLVWSAVWVAPMPRLGLRAELVAGLVAFVAFGLRVFAGFFVGVPDEDPVRSAVSPLLDWINGRAGFPPYGWVLDATVALGLAWLTSGLPPEQASQSESIVALVFGSSAGLVGWAWGGFERPRSRFLFAMAVGVATGAVVALYA